MGSSNKADRDIVKSLCNSRTGEAQRLFTELAGSPSPGAVMLAYRRCTEYDELNGEGQDFAWICAAGSRVIGVLADGVSQSFYGQIAAQRLVEGLADYLYREPEFKKSSDWQAALNTELRRIAADALVDVTNQKLRPGLSQVMLELLEEEREKGSQAVFGAFVYNRENRSAVTCQLGDVRIRVFDGNGPGKLLPCDKHGRFTIASKTTPDEMELEQFLRLETIENIGGIMIHSDGVEDVWGERPSLFAEADQELFLKTLDHWARQDDVSLVSFMSTHVMKWSAGNPILQLSEPPKPRPKPDPLPEPPKPEVPPEPQPIQPIWEQPQAPIQALQPQPQHLAQAQPQPQMQNHATTNQKIAILAVGAILLTCLSFAAGKRSARSQSDHPGNTSAIAVTHPVADPGIAVTTVAKWKDELAVIRKKKLAESEDDVDSDHLTWMQIRHQLIELENRIGATLPGTTKASINSKAATSKSAGAAGKHP